MKVLKIDPNTKPYEIKISNELKQLQNEVGGYIEVMLLPNENACIICNEEGKIYDMELNRTVYDDYGKTIDVIAGSFLIVGIEEEDFVSLPDNLMQKYKEQFNDAEIFMRGEEGVVSIKVEAQQPPERSMDVGIER